METVKTGILKEIPVHFGKLAVREGHLGLGLGELFHLADLLLFGLQVHRRRLQLQVDRCTPGVGFSYVRTQCRSSPPRDKTALGRTAGSLVLGLGFGVLGSRLRVEDLVPSTTSPASG